MNTLRRLAFNIIGVFALVQFSACTKSTDKPVGDESLDAQAASDASLQQKKCRILSFTQHNVPLGDGTRTAHFYFNSHGDIDSIIAEPETGSLGANLFYFTYDTNHKLISYSEGAGEIYPFTELHTYAYEKGRIVRDTFRVYPDGNSSEVRTLEYDNKGRIIKESRIIINDDGTVIDNINPLIFTYDNNGNLVINGASYDNAVNFLATSDELMFTQRDYSRNNRIGATAYNDSKLPLGFVEGIGATYGPSSLLSFGLPVEINYDCK